MQTNPQCPACAGRSWCKIGARDYRASDASRKSPYVRRRYRVLFDLWFPDHDEVRIAAGLCCDCGFISHLPRPEAADIEAKYSHLVSTDRDPDGQAPDAPLEQARARRLFTIAGSIRSDWQDRRVLDFGGGDGRLMRDFIAANSDCFLVDHGDTAVPGVTRLGSSEKELPPSGRFDLVVCSHVVEHLAEPHPVLKKLASHVADEGAILIEVPLEIWKRPPLPEEPVTHINFFTPASLQTLLERAGLEVLRCDLDGQPHASGYWQIVIVALARPTSAERPSPPARRNGVRQTMRYLSPGPLTKLSRARLSRGGMAGAIVSKIKQLVAAA